MESEEVCADAKVNKILFKQLTDGQDKIIVTQVQHDTRLTLLESRDLKRELEFANLKQSQTEQKALVLDLDRLTNIKIDKMAILVY